RGDGSVVVGSTVEDAAFDHHTTPNGSAELWAKLHRMAPRIAGVGTVSAAWAGLRPMTPDRFPIIGALPMAPRILLACGHGRNGVLLAPLTAHLVASIIDGGAQPLDVNPFLPTRFSIDFH